MRLPGWVTWLGWALLALNPLLISSTGLETQMAIALAIWLVGCLQRRQMIAAGVLLTALFLARPDLLVVGGLIALLMGPGLRNLVKMALASLISVLPWLVFSWFVLGSFIPDTLIIKTGMSSWAGWDYRAGLILLASRFPTAVVLAVLPAAVGLVAWIIVLLARKRIGDNARVPVALGVTAIAYYTLYSLLGVPPFHWYYGMPIALLTVVTVLAAGQFAVFLDEAGGRGWVVALVLAVPAVLSGLLLVRTDQTQEVPIAVISTNWAAPQQYEQMSAPLREIVGDQAVTSPGEVGTLAYFCDCRIVDEFSDLGVVSQKVDEILAESSGAKKALLALNYAHRGRGLEPVEATYQMVWTPGGDPQDPFFGYSAWRGPGVFVVEPAAPQPAS
jgi:hypothetical protein